MENMSKKIEDFLINNEQIIYKTFLEKKHFWGNVFLFGSIVSSIIATLIIYFFIDITSTSIEKIILAFIIILFFSLLLILKISNIYYKNTVFLISNKRVFFISNFLIPKSAEINLNKIESIIIEKKSIIYDLSNLKINGTGGHSLVFEQIEKAFEFKNKINEELEKIK